jgi:hypothetical protein
MMVCLSLMPARCSITQAAPKFSHAISSWRES